MTNDRSTQRASSNGKANGHDEKAATKERPSAKETAGRWRATVQYAYDLSRHAAGQLIAHRAPLLAAALSYRTLFSLVPVLVLVLVVLNATFGKQGIRNGLDELIEYVGLDKIEVEDATAPEAKGQVRLDRVETTTGGTTTGTDAIDDTGSETGATDNGRQYNDPQVPADAAESRGESNTHAGSADTAEELASETLSVADYLNDFLENAAETVTNVSLTGVAIVGLLVFIYAALSLLVQVENSFNAIVGATRGRSWARRIPTYWTLLTLGGLLLPGTVLLSRYINSMLERVPDAVEFAVSPVQVLLQVGGTWLVLLFAFRFMPMARLQMTPAAIGAAVAACLWELAKASLAGLVGTMFEGQAAIYGSLALVPMVLFWVYVTWLIVLFGLELAYAIQTLDQSEIVRARQRAASGAGEADRSVLTPADFARLGGRLAGASRTGQSPSVSELARELSIHEHAMAQAMGRLRDAGLVHRVMDVDDEDREEQAESEGERRYVLSRPADRVTLADLHDAFDTAGNAREDRADPLSSVRAALTHITLASLAEAEGEPAHEHEQEDVKEDAEGADESEEAAAEQAR